MADEKSKLAEFRDRITATTARVVRNPLIQGGAGAAFGPLGSLAAQGAAAAMPKLRDTTSFERTSPTTQNLTESQQQVPAPFPYNQGPEGYGTVAPAPEIPKAGTAQMGAAVGNPFGGLRERVNQAQLATMEGLDQDSELQLNQGDAKAAKMAEFAKLYEKQAADQEIDARMQQQADYDAKERHVAFLQRNEKLANDIGEQKIDPHKLMREKSTAEKGLFVMSSILGGALRGLDGGKNDALDRMDREIDQDIASQEKAIDNKKASLSARQSLFGQMLQETGDSRVAAAQARNLMYESFKQKLLSEGERLGIPEVKINAEMGARAIQAKQDANRENMAAQALHSAQQAAAAQAAARAAAEKQAWDRSMQVSELALKKDNLTLEGRKLDIEAAKNNGTTAKDVNAEVTGIAKDLADPKLANGRAPIENLKAQLPAEQDKGIAGVGRWGDVQEAVSPVLAPMIGRRSLLSDQEKVNRGDWEKLKLAYQSQITGSGASNEERKMISAAFEGARTPAEQRSAIATADALFKQQEERRLAGASPEALAVFKQRLAAQGKK